MEVTTIWSWRATGVQSIDGATAWPDVRCGRDGPVAGDGRRAAALELPVAARRDESGGCDRQLADSGQCPILRCGRLHAAREQRLGSAVSAAALVSVQSSPILEVQPSAQTVVAGGGVSFSVTAAGTPPLGYQWRFNGSNLLGATLSSYTVADAQPADAGDYSVAVTNAFGEAVEHQRRPDRARAADDHERRAWADRKSPSRFPSQTGVSYLLEYKHLLDDPAWTPLLAGRGRDGRHAGPAGHQRADRQPLLSPPQRVTGDRIRALLDLCSVASAMWRGICWQEAVPKVIYRADGTKRGFISSMLAPVNCRQEPRFGVRETLVVWPWSLERWP